MAAHHRNFGGALQIACKCYSLDLTSRTLVHPHDCAGARGGRESFGDMTRARTRVARVKVLRSSVAVRGPAARRILVVRLGRDHRERRGGSLGFRFLIFADCHL